MTAESQESLLKDSRIFKNQPDFSTIAKEILKIAVNAMIYEIVLNGMLFINSLIVSSKGDPLQLGSMGIGDTIYVCFVEGLGYGFSLGFLVELMPLAAQKNYKKACRLFHKALAASLFVIVPLCVLFLLAKPILLLMGVIPDLAKGAQSYLLSLIFSVIFAFCTWIYYTYLIAFNLQGKFAIISGVFALNEVLLVYFFLVVNQYDITWIGVSLAFYQIARTGVSVWYFNKIFMTKWPEAWTKPSWDAFKDAFEHFKKSASIMAVSLPLMLCVEVNVLIAGGLTDVEAGVQSLVFRLYSPILFITDDLSYGVISKISYHQGLGEKSWIRAYFRYGTILVASSALIFGASWYIFRGVLVDFLGSGSKEFNGHLITVLKYVGVATSLQGMLLHIAKILRSNGGALKAICMFLGTCVFVQIPLSTLLCFTYGMRLEGIWIGFLVALIVAMIIAGYLLTKININAYAEKEEMSIELTELKRDKD